MPPRDDIPELIRRAQAGDAAAMDAAVRANIGLVKAIASRFVGDARESEDIYQVAYLGLVKAIKGFDASLGVRFSTYAVPTIMGEIRRYLRDARLLRVTRSAYELGKRALKAQRSLQAALGREPSVREICEESGLMPEEVLEGLEALRPLEWLDAPMYPEEPRPRAQLDSLTSPDGVEGVLEREAIRQVFRLLEPRERRLIAMRYAAGMTQAEVAARLGISQAQVSRTEQKALLKLRGFMSQ